MIENRLKLETECLKQSWMRYDQRILRNYLVRDVEDPRINMQSILTRHFLIRQLFNERFDDLMEHELRFSLVMNWSLRLLKKPIRLWQLQAILGALLAGDDETEGIAIPSYLSETFAALSLPNYICDLLNWSPDETADGSIPAYLLSTFQTI